MTARLHGEIVPAVELAPADSARMYELHAAHYEGVEPSRFHKDLTEKDWIILLRDEKQRLVGFSTQKLLTAATEQGQVRALFSGDTIIAREHWGAQELVRTWCRFAGWLLAQEPATPLYWFLISKGYRTYLYLPLFFREWYPRRDNQAPESLKRMLDILAVSKFGGEYDPITGLITPAGPHDRLKPELDATPRRFGNPDVVFFCKRNPNYAEGIELACLAEISVENMRGAARRELKVGMLEAALDET